MNQSGERILDLDIPQETTLNSPLIFSNPRKNQRTVTMVPENPPLESIRTLESFRSIEENNALDNIFTSGFSRTPGPKSNPIPDLLKSPELFNLFPDQEKGRLINYSDLKSQHESTSYSPLVQGMIAELLTSFSPTPDKLSRTFSLSDKSDSGTKEKKLFDNNTTPFKSKDEVTDTENPDFLSNRWNSPNVTNRSRFSNNGLFPKPLDAKNKALLEQDILPESKEFTMNETALPPLKTAIEWEKDSMFSRLSAKTAKSDMRSVSETEGLGWRSSHTNNPLFLDLRSSNDSKTYSKQDLIESPRSKAIFKEFSSKFRQISKRSSLEAENYALKEAEQMGDQIKYKVYLELAELSKKNDDSEKARNYYIRAACNEKRASSVWLEWSKMEEENGRPDVALEILIVGIIVCKLNDTLLPRLLKLQERAGKFNDIRTILSWLKFESIEKTWKSILEGCLFEVRSGHLEIASEFFKFLMKQVPWYGPIYFEAFQLEENQKHISNALSIIRRGLMELPRYGPLWFGLIRMVEAEDFKYEKRLWQLGSIPQFSKLSFFTFESLKSISKELTWRVYYERFEAETRASCIVARGLQNSSKYPAVGFERILSKVLTHYRHNLIRALLLCPANLKWKLYLIAAREEIVVGNIENARNWALKAIMDVPIKSKATALIECSRLEEYAGNFSNARKILTRARSELHHDWRSYFESIAFESRNKNFHSALRIAKRAVNYHNGTGRIWAIYIQLFHRLQRNPFEQDKLWNFARTSQGLKIIVRKAINEVPKSGEVWCEMGRCALNPLLPDHFNLHRAQLSLMFAIQFTPQYGDTFIEYLRLEILLKVFLKTLCENLLGIPFAAFASRFCSLDPESDILSGLSIQESEAAFLPVRESGVPLQQKDMIRRIFSNDTEQELSSMIFKQLRQITNEEFPLLKRRCVNANPNYGSLWFYCRKNSHNSTTNVLQNAKNTIVYELKNYCVFYMRAVLIFIRNCLQENQAASISLQELLFEIPTENDFCSQSVFSSSSPSELCCVSDFVTGIVATNRNLSQTEDLEGKKRLLFGVDQIVN